MLEVGTEEPVSTGRPVVGSTATEPSEGAVYEPVVAPWEVMFGDGGWRRVALMGWSTNRNGQRVCDLSWRADDGENLGGFHLFDPERMREA